MGTVSTSFTFHSGGRLSINANVVRSERNSLILSVAQSILCHLITKIASG